ncbi:deoxyribonuclease [macacine betaherpesvirus 9]|uniref:Deoxyribonuclease n=1 Tax=macacine betaherpesvirus 9 TaxID=2560568 RepID=A0A191S3T5_9BETA|nr:deoxyribonuclease [macacine betaherpesvirus 9]ANC96545.1 deoxyribonuclease [macacine betaherpesvirus 9]
MAMDYSQISYNLISILNEESVYLFLIDKFNNLKISNKKITFNFIRLCYTYYVLIKYNSSFKDSVLARSFVDYMQQNVESLTNKNVKITDLYCNVYHRLQNISPRIIKTMFKILERETRGQYKNPLWHAMRKNCITASKIYDIYISKSFVDMQENVYRGEAALYGIKHETIIQHLVSVFFTKIQFPTETLGLLLDPSSGVFGASIDLYYGIDFTEDNLIEVNNKISIFELKFRFKYLRDKNDVFVIELLKNPSEKTLSNFILSHQVPAIEFRENGKIPSAREYLISHNSLYDSGKKRRSCSVPRDLADDITRLIILNEKNLSTVLVFDVIKDSILNTLSVFQKAKFTIDAFINPRHRYYFQSILQQYVMTQFYIQDHNNPEYIQQKNVPLIYIVSAIFRQRDEAEKSYRLLIENTEYIDEEIPLLLLITPISVDAKFTSRVISDICSIWEKNITRQTNLEIWAQSAVRQYMMACLAKPKTP